MSNGLDVALMKDPYGKWSPEDGDHHTEIGFGDDEWAAFYYETLKAEQTIYVIDEPWTVYSDRREATFRASLKDYPLLARLNEFYRDASFAPDEIYLLREELNRARVLRLTEQSKTLLDGMLSACDSAESLGLGIRLLSS